MTVPPDPLPDPPNLAQAGGADLLSDVLGALRLTGGVFLDAEFTAPWCIIAKVGPEDCQPFAPEPAQVIAYHYVVEGRLLLQLEGEPPVEVAAGEIVLLPRNDEHILASGPKLRPVDAGHLIQPAGEGGLARIVHGRRRRAHPPFVRVSRQRWPGRSGPREPAQGPEARHRGGHLRRLDAELVPLRRRSAAGRIRPGPGQARRAAVRRGPAPLPVHLAARADRLACGPARTGGPPRARAASRPRRPSLDHRGAGAGGRPLAVGLRGALHHAPGGGPDGLLARWRMQIAADRLRQGQPVARIAYEVGYESEAAFNRAFKRAFGTPPAAWRKGARGS